MRRNKRGSLSLSINAIVVLILAITMLGLGLGFIRTMFGKVSTNVEGVISQEPEPGQANAGNPITISRETVVARAGDSIGLKVNIYNPTIGDIGVVSNGLVGSTCAPLGTVSNVAKTVVKQTQESFTILGSVPPTQLAGTTLCQVAAGSLKKEFIVKIVT